MNSKHYKLLRYVLIILLMFSPMRSVMAMQSSHCDMSAMSAMSSSDFMQQSGITLSKNTETSNFPDSTFAHQHSDEQQQMNHKCCSSDGNSCGSDCDMGITVSLLMQVSLYSPVFVNTEKLILSSPELLIRALTPPSRPPLIIS